MKVFFKKMDQSLKKVVSRRAFWVIFCGLGFFFPIIRSFNRELPDPSPVYFEVPSFSLTDENGDKFGSDELQGKVYVANFIFTSCPSTCPKLTQEMQLIQKRVRGLGNKIALLSLTVDPETDTPATLFKYARKVKANPYIWRFLTGESEKIKKLVIGGFKVPLGEKKFEGGKWVESRPGKIEEVTLMDIAHTEKFVLVDGQGRVRGFYSAEKGSINRMMIDIGLLVNRS